MPDREKNSNTDPEQLLKMLDAELAVKRQQRLQAEEKQRAFRIYGLLIIVVGTAVALMALYFILQSMKESGGGFPHASPDEQL